MKNDTLDALVVSDAIKAYDLSKDYEDHCKLRELADQATDFINSVE